MATIRAASAENMREWCKTPAASSAPGSPCCGKLARLICHLFGLIDAVGIDHVGIGTDLPAGAAKAEIPDFSRHAEIAAALRARGMTEAKVVKVCAGNWLREFSAVRA